MCIFFFLFRLLYSALEKWLQVFGKWHWCTTLNLWEHYSKVYISMFNAKDEIYGTFLFTRESYRFFNCCNKEVCTLLELHFWVCMSKMFTKAVVKSTVCTHTKSSSCLVNSVKILRSVQYIGIPHCIEGHYFCTFLDVKRTLLLYLQITLVQC